MSSVWGAENPYRNATNRQEQQERQEQARQEDRREAAATAGRGQRRI